MLQFAFMKTESLVIVNQDVTVKVVMSSTHTAHHIQKVLVN